jgi:hypothetical protein
MTSRRACWPYTGLTPWTTLGPLHQNITGSPSSVTPTFSQNTNMRDQHRYHNWLLSSTPGPIPQLFIVLTFWLCGFCSWYTFRHSQPRSAKPAFYFTRLSPLDPLGSKYNNSALGCYPLYGLQWNLPDWHPTPRRLSQPAISVLTSMSRLTHMYSCLSRF